LPEKNNVASLWLHLFDTDPPEWVITLNEDEFINLMRLRAHDTAQHLRSLYANGEIIYSVFNEELQLDNSKDAYHIRRGSV
jgi:hypothetical protein